jgi:hypothetical protein
MTVQFMLMNVGIANSTKFLGLSPKRANVGLWAIARFSYGCGIVQKI